MTGGRGDTIPESACTRTQQSQLDIDVTWTCTLRAGHDVRHLDPSGIEWWPGGFGGPIDVILPGVRSR